MNAYLVVFDQSDEWTFVVISDSSQAAVDFASQFYGQADEVTASLLCNADRVIGLENKSPNPPDSP